MSSEEQRADPSGRDFFEKVIKSAEETLKPAFSIIRFLLLIMLPVSFVVLVLETSGLLYYISDLMDPLMGKLGLPGESALALLSSIFVNIYSAIAVIKSLSLSGKQIIILASMCLIAHNFFVELIVMKKTGSPLSKMVLLRLSAAFFAAWVLHRIVPENAGTPITAADPVVYNRVIEINLERLRTQLGPWFKSSIFLVFQVFAVVFIVMFVQRLLSEFGIMKKLGDSTAPILKILGLPANSGYVWIIASTVGVAYGAGVLIEEVREGKLSRPETDLFNHHAAISHSQIEDTALFVSIGVPYLWAALPRFFLAIAVVWLEKIRRYIFRRSFRVKVM